MQLDRDYFARMQDTAFRVGPADQSVELTLASVEPIAQSHRDGGAFRLEFRGPAEPALSQGTQNFSFGEGAFDIFIVPVGRDAGGMIYEAIFN